MAKTYKFPTDISYWAEFNFSMLERANEFHVLQMEGWERSAGLAVEIAFWARLNRGSPAFVTWGPK
jgi:Domain of unknown function (DUF1937)